MKKEKLLICDHDVYYVEYLTDYLNRQPDFPCEAVPFTRIDALLEYQGRGRSWPVLVDEFLAQQLPEAEDAQEDDRSNGGQVVILLREDDAQDGICRYQSCEDLKREILEYLRRFDRSPGSRLSGPPGLSRGEEGEKGVCPLYGVYSPVSRCGKTIFAVTLGMVLAEYRQVLYLNLENYHGLDGAVGGEPRNDLADLIYQFRTEGENGVKKLLTNAVTEWGKLDCLNPAFSAYDLNEVDAAEWLQLLAAVIAAGGYEAVVLDVGSQIREVFSLLGACDLLFVPVLNDRISKAKLQQFEENIKAMQMQDLADRIRKIVVPKLRGDGELTGFPKQLPRGRIGSYARQIAEAEHLMQPRMMAAAGPLDLRAEPKGQAAEI